MTYRWATQSPKITCEQGIEIFHQIASKREQMYQRTREDTVQRSSSPADRKKTEVKNRRIHKSRKERIKTLLRLDSGDLLLFWNRTLKLKFGFSGVRISMISLPVLALWPATKSSSDWSCGNLRGTGSSEKV
jgi:hypothetical protein